MKWRKVVSPTRHLLCDLLKYSLFGGVLQTTRLFELVKGYFQLFMGQILKESHYQNIFTFPTIFITARVRITTER